MHFLRGMQESALNSTLGRLGDIAFSILWVFMLLKCGCGELLVDSPQTEQGNISETSWKMFFFLPLIFESTLFSQVSQLLSRI